jgi:hypothetical protein
VGHLRRQLATTRYTTVTMQKSMERKAKPYKSEKRIVAIELVDFIDSTSLALQSFIALKTGN